MAVVGVFLLDPARGRRMVQMQVQRAVNGGAEALALDALAFSDACHASGVPGVLERSRSGDGAHVWVFFGGLVPATQARALGAALLRQAMSARAELDLASYGSSRRRTSSLGRGSATGSHCRYRASVSHGV